MPQFEVSSGVTKSLQYQDFANYVRRFSFLPTLKTVSEIAWTLADDNDRDFERSWLYSHVARALLINGPDRDGSAKAIFSLTDEANCLIELKSVNQHVADVNDPLGAKRYLVALSQSFFHFQDDSAKNSVARFLSLLGQPRTEKIQQFDWEAILGLTLNEYFAACLGLIGIFTQSHGLPVEKLIVSSDMTSDFGVTQESLLTVFEMLSIRFSLLPDSLENLTALGVDYYAPNPLISSPLVHIKDHFYCCPFPSYLYNAIGSGLYYLGISKRGSAFSSALGEEFEAYIEDQIRLLDPESLFKVPVSNTPRCDWIVRHGSTYFLIEAKTQRLDATARAGGENFEEQVNKVIGEPIDQINNTYIDIMGDHPDFLDVDKGANFRGLVISLEPFYMANSIGLQTVKIEQKIKTSFVHSNEIEILFSSKRRDLAFGVLIDMQDEAKFAGQALWEVMNNYPDLYGHENPILESAMKSAGWT